jgi:hypothetical protein
LSLGWVKVAFGEPAPTLVPWQKHLRAVIWFGPVKNCWFWFPISNNQTGIGLVLVLKPDLFLELELNPDPVLEPE